MTIICFYVQTDLIVSGRQKERMTMIVSTCQRTWLSLEEKKGVDDHDCLRMTSDFNSLLKVNDRGLWVLWKINARTSSPTKVKGEDFESYEGEPIGTRTKGL